MHPIIVEIAAEFGIEPASVCRHAATRSHRGARYKAAYRLVTETDLPISEIAELMNYADWSGINHAVSAHAASIGVAVTTTTELRHGVPARAIDWKRLGEHLRASYRAKDYRKAGCTRMVWMAAMRGKRLNADDFLFLMRRLGLAIETYATPEYLAIKPFS